MEEILTRWQRKYGIDFNTNNIYTGIGIDDRERSAKNGNYNIVIGVISYTQSRCVDDLDIICTEVVHFQDILGILVTQNVSQSNGMPSAFTQFSDACVYFGASGLGKNLRIAVIGTTNTSDILARCQPSINPPVSPMNRSQVVEALTDNPPLADVYITDYAIIQNLANQNSSLLTAIPLQTNDVQRYIFMLPSDHEGLRDLIDEELRAMQADGTYTEIFNQSFSGFDPMPTPPPNFR